MINAFLIFLGGGAGALLRYLILISSNITNVLNILMINLIGCFLMGAAFAYLSAKSPIYTLISIGFLGSFTTMSAFTQTSLEMILDSKYFNAFFYGILMLSMCVIANIIGYLLMKREMM